MTQHQSRVTAGTKFYLDGDQHVVEALSGTSILVRSSKGRSTLYHAASLFNMKGFRIRGADSEQISESPLYGIPAPAIAQASAFARHLLELITGYQSGSSEDAAPGEPKREYDPAIFHMSQRLAHKASELRMTERAIWQAKHSYEAYGLMGLVDKRKLRQRGTLIDERVRMKLKEVIASFEEKSNPSKVKLEQLTGIALRESFPGAQIDFPSRSAFNRLVDVLDMMVAVPG